MREITFPAPASARCKAGAMATFRLFDAGSAFVDHCTGKVKDARLRAESGWMGAKDTAEIWRQARQGDVSQVPAADKMLAKFEDVVIPSARHRRAYDVAGAAPVVPAYLSGNPLNMVRRKTFRDEAAPVAVCFDGTTSSAVKASEMRARGVAVLALVRALLMRRPVELWVGAGLDSHPSSGNPGGSWHLCRINTAPLEIAQAAHYLTSPSIIRGLCYGLSYHHDQSSGHWPYQSFSVVSNVQAWEDHCRLALPHAESIIAVPAILNSDPLLRDPLGWIKAKLAAYTTDDADAA